MERPSLATVPLSKDDRKLWRERTERMGELYTELLPFLDPKNPAMAKARDELQDLVPNAMQNLGVFNRAGSQYALERLLEHFAPRTPEYFAHTEAALREQIADPQLRHHARRVADDLEWCMREAYDAGAKLLLQQTRAGEVPEKPPSPQTIISEVKHAHHIYRRAIDENAPDQSCATR